MSNILKKNLKGKILRERMRRKLGHRNINLGNNQSKKIAWKSCVKAVEFTVETNSTKRYFG